MNAIIRAVKRWWRAQDHRWDDPLVEGWWADQYRDPAIQSRIRSEYQARYTVERTPWTHPLDFDPLKPPQGWRYDPYYECWVRL